MYTNPLCVATGCAEGGLNMGRVGSQLRYGERNCAKEQRNTQMGTNIGANRMQNAAKEVQLAAKGMQNVA